MTSALARGQAAFGDRAWRVAFEALTEADVDARLDAADLERCATAGYLLGRDVTRIWERAHDSWVGAGEPGRAARCAFWMGFGLLDRGEAARGSGWLGRAQQLVEQDRPDCAERGLLLLPQAMACFESGDPEGALAAFSEMCELGDRFGDDDVRTLGRLGRGQALTELGDRAAGLALLDEVIVAVTTEEVSPMVVGLAYCAAIAACQRTYDLARAHEWTLALTRWCDAQPDLVPYRGQCLVHRAEILQLHGAWPAATDELARACERLEGAPAAGDAWYRRGEMHRLRGEWAEAEDAYRAATRAGRQPQPGLALLRLAQDRVPAAEASIRRVVDEARSRADRAEVLGPSVEIALAAGALTEARGAADELSVLAGEIDAGFLHTVAAQAMGAVLLAEGDARAALEHLRRAWRAWREIEAPYEAARVRVAVARACLALGDADTAEMELDAARSVFTELGAAPDLADVDRVLRPRAPGAFGPLTAREVEVVTLAARGATNRAIGEELFISEKTVARHLANIFAKLGTPSRAAATAWAYESGLLEPPAQI